MKNMGPAIKSVGLALGLVLGCIALIGCDSIGGTETEAVVARQGFSQRCEPGGGSGPTWAEQQRFRSPSPGVFEEFGYSVALSSDTAVVANGLGGPPPVVFAREDNGLWTAQQVLVTGNSRSVAVDGDTIVVGVPGTALGSASVFVRAGTAWMKQQSLTASDEVSGDAFGHGTAISGETVLIGAAGGAYVFVRSGTIWTEQQKLVPSTAPSGVSPAYTVALSGDTALVASHVYVRSGAVWTEQQMLLPTSGTLDGFGYSVALGGDTAVIGAPFDEPFTMNGAAYVYVRSGTTWTLQQRLLPADGQNYQSFGSTVARDGDILAVGAGYNFPASIFVRSGTSWSGQTIPPLNSAAVDGTTILGGVLPNSSPFGFVAVYVPAGTPICPALVTWTSTASGDTYLKEGTPNKNQGSLDTVRLEQSGKNRGLVRFDLNGLVASLGSVTSARLTLTIADNGNNWGTTGRAIAAHRLTQDWTELGSTWNCATDTNTSNSSPNCTSAWAWEMGKPSQPQLHPWLAGATATATITNGLCEAVNLDVTTDVAAYLAGSASNFGWILKKVDEGAAGRVDFASRETATPPTLTVWGCPVGEVCCP